MSAAPAVAAPLPVLGASPASLALYHGRWLLTQSSGGIGFAGSSYATLSKSDWKSWHPLAAPLMRLQNTGGFMPQETAEWMVISGGREEESGTNFVVWRHASSTNGADNATPLSMPLDGKPHVMGSPPVFAASPASSATHRKAITLTASQVPAPAASLADGGSSVALHLQIDLPPEKKLKASNFAEEQIALHRAGYILCRSMLPSRSKLVQITEYHRAPASMKNDVVAALDTSQVPTVYAVTRVFQRVERKEDVEDAGASSVSASSSTSVSASSSVPSTPVRQASTRSVSSASATIAPTSAASASTPTVAPTPRPAQILPPPTLELEPAAAAAPAASMSVSDSPNDAASSVSSSSSSSSASASASSQPLPPIPFCTLTGVWKVDRTRSDTLEGMMKELNVAWLARKVILALEVLTHIKHEPDQHHCVVTDVSSAGEQATVHYTSGEINEVKTKEGKTIRMCAKEGEEMRVAGVWPHLPAPMLHAPLSFPASDIPWSFPSYLPAPIAPDLKLHPLPYGYLWIHSFLPDIPGGEMQDVRLLLDRDCMVQQTMIIKHRKLAHTTTRYFTKVESPAEKQKSEAEWEESCTAWKAAMAARGAGGAAHTRTASRAGMDTTSEDTSDDESMLSSPQGGGGASLHSSRSISRSSTSNGLLTPIPPSPHLTPGMLGFSPTSGAPPNPLVPVPDLSGVWVVWKERSNDLGVLLKRMGVPWIYRAFANTVDIRTTITHTTKELILKDSSKLGSHSQVFKLDGAWAPVVQYGNQRHGQCKVSSDPLAQSVTVETVYFAANAGRSKISVRQARAEAQAASQQTPLVEERPASSRGSRAGSSAHSSAPPTPSLNESLLTGESPMSPAPVPKLALDEHDASAASSDSIRLAPDGLLIEPLPMPAAGANSSGPSPARSAEHSPRQAARSLRADSLSEPEGIPAASMASAVPATPAAASSSSASAVPVLSVRTSDEPGHSRSASSSLLVQSSMPSTPAAGPVSTRATPSTPASTTSSASSSAFSSPNVLAPAQGSMAITSRVIDIRCLLSPDLMRQVITYLEFEVVICVCSRYYRREQTAAERKAVKAAEEARKRDEQEQIKRAQKEEEQKRKKDEAERRNRTTNANAPAGAPGSATYSVAAAGSVVAAAAGAVGSSSAASGAPAAAAPVSVVVPSPAVSSAAASSSSAPASAALSSASLSDLLSSASLSLSSVTPSRAFLFLLLSVAVCSGHRLLMLAVLAAVAAYAWMLHQQLMLQQEEQRKIMVAAGAVPAAFVPPAAALAPQANAPFTAPILPIGRGMQVEVVPLRRAANA